MVCVGGWGLGIEYWGLDVRYWVLGIGSLVLGIGSLVFGLNDKPRSGGTLVETTHQRDSEPRSGGTSSHRLVPPLRGSGLPFVPNATNMSPLRGSLTQQPTPKAHYLTPNTKPPTLNPPPPTPKPHRVNLTCFSPRLFPVFVLHLPKWYPHRYETQDGDFVARHVEAIAAADAALRTAVVFAAVARQPLPKLIDREVDLTGPVPTWRYYYRNRLTGWGALDKLLKLLLWLECMRRGIGAVRQHWAGQRPDIIHTHIMLRPAALALWLKLWWGTPYLITENWTAFLTVNAHRLPWWRGKIAGLLVRQSAAFTPVSDDLRRALARLGGVSPRTAIIPNVVDTEQFQPPAPGAARRGLLNVAAFNERAKNLSGLLRTVARLRDEGLPLHLRIAGFGAAEAAMHALAAELGLLADGTVEFLGKLEHQAVAEEMQQAACFVLFSNYENLPCVLIEAQAAGLPVVATHVNGVPELVGEDERFGLLVPVADEAALAVALRRVLRGEVAFEEEKLRDNAVKRYSVAAVGAAFRRVYGEVAGQ